jgi:hypothetical protein
LFQHWGASRGEIDGPVVGDEFIADAGLVATRCIDLDAPPDEVFPWLCQLGFGRAGWYSYDWIDNLGRRSATRIHPEWQGIATGDTIPGGPIGFEAAVVDPPHAFVLRLPGTGRITSRVRFTLAFELRDGPGGGTRLVSRVRSRIELPFGRLIERWLLGPGDGLMVRRQLLNLRKRTASRM